MLNKMSGKLKILCGLICAGLMTGCGRTAAPGTDALQEIYDSGFVPATVGNYDSMDTAVVVKKDTAAATVTFLNLELGKKYTLNYDGATSYADKYSQPIALSQVEPGMIADVTFMHGKKRLNTLRLSAEAFVFDDIKGLETDASGHNIYLGGEIYNLDRRLAVITPDGTGELMDINAVDTLRITGIDHSVYGIYVKSGHGYLRLLNSDYFNGGWVQIGDSLVSQIREDMLLAVPEGEHMITVSNKGSSGTEKVKITRGEESGLDVGGWVKEPEYGSIIFTVVPEDAKVYIDGEKTDISDKVKLTYGIHQMVAAADGYTTVSRYIKVASELANLNIILEKDPNATASENEAGKEPTASPTPTQTPTPTPVSANSVEMIEVVPTVTPTPTPLPEEARDAASVGQYRVYIDEPEHVEVYRDGIYLGISPVWFKREPGTYEITLRKSGYQTRSYTINVTDEASDLNYSFSELEHLE